MKVFKMNCPKCSSTEKIKSGIVGGRQRYKCKKCNYFYTVKQKSTAKSNEFKRQALEMYLEGLGFRSIARILKVSNVAVLKWIRAYGKQVQNLKSDNKAQIIEIDEMHTYIKKKLLLDMDYC